MTALVQNQSLLCANCSRAQSVAHEAEGLSGATVAGKDAPFQPVRCRRCGSCNRGNVDQNNDVFSENNAVIESQSPTRQRKTEEQVKMRLLGTNNSTHASSVVTFVRMTCYCCSLL